MVWKTFQLTDRNDIHRARFPEVRIIPKQHVLEAHCVQWIRRWGFGLALHGEQGGEEIHATVNRIQRRAWGMRNYEDRLRLLMKEQLTQASPVLQATPPTPHLPLPHPHHPTPKNLPLDKQVYSCKHVYKIMT